MPPSPTRIPTGPRAAVRRLLTALVVVLLGGTLLSPSPPATASPGSAGDPYFPWDGNSGYDVEHYDINATMRLKKRKLEGRTTLTARATDDLPRFHLDLLLRTKTVEVNGEPAVFDRPNKHELRVTPAAPIAAGETFTVTVTYAGKPHRARWQGESAWLGNRHEVVAMGEPHIAAWWFPANDHPSDKARFDIRIRVPRGKQVVANGKRVARKVAQRWTTFHWRARDPMTTYLAFFAAGDFRVRTSATRGLHQVVAVSKRLGKKARKRSHTLVHRSAKIVRRLEKWLGPYPFETTGGVVTSLDTGFALENQTRPTYPNLRHEDNYLIAHELAHQWFGDRVALRAWRDIWINEGFATWLGLACQSTCSANGMNRWLRSLWQAHPAGSRFWRLTIGDPGPKKIFADAVYTRGAMAVQALRRRIGATAFHELLRAWVSDREHGTVAEFRALAEAVSGHDLDSFFTAWLDSPTRPARTSANGLA